LFFAFTHTNAIYVNPSYCGQAGSFYKWAGERDNLTLKTGSIYVAFILVMKF